jgi:hypothetical protein
VKKLSVENVKNKKEQESSKTEKSIGKLKNDLETVVKNVDLLLEGVASPAGKPAPNVKSVPVEDPASTIMDLSVYKCPLCNAQFPSNSSYIAHFRKDPQHKTLSSVSESTLPKAIVISFDGMSSPMPHSASRSTFPSPKFGDSPFSDVKSSAK